MIVTWDNVIQRNSSYLIVGDVGTGKSGLAYYLMERYSQKYNLQPVTVGLPESKRSLIPPNWAVLNSPESLVDHENIIAFVDEADIQLSIEDVRAREKVTNFLSLPRQRKQILLLCFHFPRLVMARYLPFFSAFLLKRPPYLVEFASKSKGDALYKMMIKAEEKFTEMIPTGWMPGECNSQPEEVLSSTYVVAPRLRWQGVIKNPTASFWTQELSEVWAGVAVGSAEKPLDPLLEHVRQELGNISPDLMMEVVYLDTNYTQEEIVAMCEKRGLSSSGTKKQMAMRILHDLMTIKVWSRDLKDDLRRTR
jgi:hypothetical protein